jgi:hypothetical protein
VWGTRLQRECSAPQELDTNRGDETKGHEAPATSRSTPIGTLAA